MTTVNSTIVYVIYSIEYRVAWQCKD